ncbi:MAG: hypothetical protein K2G69_02180 [Muribaculaceae bacterium]|nr:hypothetical protein [Muribaculaceae bacterium]
MKPTDFKFILGSLLIATCFSVSAQNDRSYIRNAIKEWGQCRNVAITRSNGDIALYGRNGCARSNVPKGLDDAITQLNRDKEFIDDIQLTENGRWLILYGNNGIRWNDIPYSLENKLREFNNEGEVITSVTFNDAGNWIVITTNYISASDSGIQNWLSEGLNKYGALWAACITDDGIAAVFERGYQFFGNIPEDLKVALTKTQLDVYRLKIAGTAWFFADVNGRFRYNM